MIDLAAIDYSAFDKPEICRRLFYPRQDSSRREGGGAERLMIPVDQDVALGGLFHESGKEAPTILFFHGNGEIVTDYDDIGSLYHRMGINFLPVDYRGYGFSSGRPTVTEMMRDSHRVFHFVTSWLSERGFSGPIVLMGRSLGSAPALEIAFHNGEGIAGLIIESGFARILPLLNLLGIHDPELTEASGPQNLEKIKRVQKPTLIIHAEYDHIIPFAEGEDLYTASGATEKQFVRIPGADHNDILFRGMRLYLEAIGKFAEIVTVQRY
jgi:alpha-beta hydrolase superfamily lysophospholipase